MKITKPSRSSELWLRLKYSCPKCGGTGEDNTGGCCTPKYPKCGFCNGTGRVEK